MKHLFSLCALYKKQACQGIISGFVATLLVATSVPAFAQSCPPKQRPVVINKTAVQKPAEAFVAFEFKIKDARTLKLITDDLKVGVELKEYSTAQKSLKTGVFTFHIPAEMVNDSITITISGEGYTATTILLATPQNIPDVLLTSKIDADKKERQENRHNKRKWWQKKQKKNKWKRLITPTF